MCRQGDVEIKLYPESRPSPNTRAGGNVADQTAP